ncbi:FtsX-like permease family protein [Streptomyces sp. TRM66268-LWL]|uniref:FtsX-like permease family protein n=1 Tax=Streptomyces polyasparticus TaxID=2767826 RepID=A0ABR7SI48_9ACTN|nr:FtsX-like permease family protein [Streptomyces polyasparticus]MBC9713983.1 FtsX-like permease family protein [Streptomyces polyasparticus]
MLIIALATLRTRWVSFLGSFAALFLGTALIAAMGQVLASTVGTPDRGPQRYAAAPVVVVPDGQLTVQGRQGATSAPLAEPRGLSPELAARFPGAVVDRVFPARLAGGPPAVGRPWSAARTAPQRLTDGRAPAGDGEIAVSASALTAGAGTPLGDEVTVVTAGAAKAYTVVGVTAAGPEGTVFFADTAAAALSPRIDALALWEPAAAVREAVDDSGAQADDSGAQADHNSAQADPNSAQVLTGADRALPDPARAEDARARNNANTVVGIAGGFAAFVAVFVVSSTFAFAVSQRRREFALLRTVGATRRQVRRMVHAEAWLIAVAASALGALAGPSATRPVLDWLIGLGAAPAWTVASGSAVPSVVAFPTGVLVALLGAAAAARRAGRVTASQALREAAVESRAMTPARWVLGLGTLGTALVCMAVTAVGDPSSAANNKTAMPVVMLLVAAAGLLSPVAVAPVTRLLAAPLERLRGATGTVVSGAALASSRQTALVAAPVLVTIGLTAALLGGAATGDAAKTALRTEPVRAEYLVLPDGGSGLDRQLVSELRKLPGVDVATSAPTSLYTLEGDTVLIRRPVEAVDPKELPAALEVPLASGSFEELDDHGVVVSPFWGKRLGDKVPLWRADGSKVSLTVVGLLGEGTAADAYTTRAHAFSALPSVAYVKLREGTAPTAAEALLRKATAGHNAHAVTKAEWTRDDGARGRSASRIGLLAVLAIILAYTAIALVSTVLMATADRVPERRALRLLGARRSQVLRFVAAEALLVVGIGTVLAAGTAALGLAGLWISLAQLTGPIGISLPWGTIAAVTGGCVLLAVSAAVGSALLTDRAGLGARV